MRRFLFGVVIASVATAMPGWAFGGDREIAKAVMAELQQHKAAGSLKGFDLDMQVEDGIVYLDGRVSSRAQRNLVAQAAANAVGAGNLVNNIQVVEQKEGKPSVSRKALPKTVTVAKPLNKEVPSADVKVAPAAANQAVPNSSEVKTKATGDRPVDIKAVQPAGGQGPAKPLMADADVTDEVISRLQELKASGKLRGFELDVSTVNGDLWLKGQVASPDQKSMVLDAARRVLGVKRVVDDMQIVPAAVRTASTGGLEPSMAQPSPVPQAYAAAAPMMDPMPQGSSMPTGQYQSMPQSFGPAMTTGAPVPAPAAAMPATPVPMQGGMAYGAGAPRYDQPNLPSYAWPSYAAYPNYAAVTYPRQYSPSAWPYIGPFYPYPQVPLGWRQVSLEWDDGLWYLDFTSKAH